MAAEEQPLDEILWRDDEFARSFGVHENTVLFYFAKSPFFDQSSNNASLETQAMFNPNMAHVLETRETFEGHLQTMQGLEFRVAFSPRDFGGEAPIGEGLWVIRKQNRRKRPDGNEEIEVLASYYVVGENVYMAPSVADVLAGRMMAATSSLVKSFEKASGISTFTPSLGHRYFPPTIARRDNTSTLQNLASRETSPQANPSTLEEGQEGVDVRGTDELAERGLLYDSFNQFLRFRGEYMDENPLLGEPGSFVFSSSTTRVQQQHAAKVQAALGEAAKAASEPSVKVEEATPSRMGSPAEPANSTDAAPSRKAKRRKSKAPPSPAPRSPLSAVNGGEEL